ncbi:MAG: hypothetical protein ACLTPG_08535 [Mediterraneibacter gnavus]
MTKLMLLMANAPSAMRIALRSSFPLTSRRSSVGKCPRSRK